MKNHIMLPAKKISLSLLLSLLSSILVHSQTALPISYSPDGPISSIITKGDTLIVGGDFRHVGKYTGGGALLSPNSDDPILSFPKINGTILSSSPDGNGGFYVYGSFYKESENPSLAHSRIEHILADYTFEANFSITTNDNIR